MWFDVPHSFCFSLTVSLHHTQCRVKEGVHLLEESTIWVVKYLLSAAPHLLHYKWKIAVKLYELGLNTVQLFCPASTMKQQCVEMLRFPLP